MQVGRTLVRGQGGWRGENIRIPQNGEANVKGIIKPLTFKYEIFPLLMKIKINQPDFSIL